MGAGAVEAAASVGAAVVFVGGDPKAVPLLRDQLGALDTGTQVIEVEGGRGGGDALAALRESVDEALVVRFALTPSGRDDRL